MFKLASIVATASARSAWQSLVTPENPITKTKSEIRWSSVIMPLTEEARINGTVAVDYQPQMAPLGQDDNEVRVCVTTLDKKFVD